VISARFVRFDERRGTSRTGTLVQVSIACILVMLGSFNQILGYFVPMAVFFLGLSAAAVLVLPRPAGGANVFRAPWHPLPILVFLLLILVLLALFVMGSPRQTLAGAAVVALSVPVYSLMVRRHARLSDS
jgi:hypothetical protein